MYERLLDKQNVPTYEDLLEYCGSCRSLLESLNDFLVNMLNNEKQIRFPYGNSYGWGIKYFIKSKLICDVFAEKDAFTVMLRLTNVQFEKLYDEMSDYTKKNIDNKYPCGDAGGWIHFRVLNEQHLNDIKILLKCKVKNKI